MRTGKHALIFAAAVALAVPALAGHGRAGLWDSKGTTTNNGKKGTNTMSFCMTKAKADRPETILQMGDSCKLQNAGWKGEKFEADLVCKGDMTGGGKIKMHFLSPERYAASASFKGVMNGAKADILTEVEAHFVASDCGDVH